MNQRPLLARLIERIEEHGPIGFDEFMEAALYDPTHGFYAQGGRGPGADFVTSPTLSPLFGATLAKAVGASFEAMGSPVPFTLCEVGAGTGSLTADLVGAGADANAEWVGAVEVVVVERSAMPQTAPGWQLRRDLADVAPFEGMLVANELLDNLPVRLRVDGTEIRVGAASGELTFVPEPDLDRLRPDPVGVRAFLDQASRVLRRGYALLIDYSGSGVRAFAGHGLSEELLEAPGERDVTASVDWSLVEDEARRRGLTVVSRQPQRDVLMQLGLAATLGSLRDAELEAVRAQDHWTSLRLRDQWTRATALVDPAGPGGFEALLLGRDVPAGLPWVSR